MRPELLGRGGVSGVPAGERRFGIAAELSLDAGELGLDVAFITAGGHGHGDPALASFLVWLANQARAWLAELVERLDLRIAGQWGH